MKQSISTRSRRDPMRPCDRHSPGSLGTAAQAQDFPTKAVRIITPFPVGSGPEGVLRLLADKLSRTWGKPVTVENKPGGNGFIAIDAFKRGAPDGYDLIQLDNVHLSAYPHLFKKLPYDATKDFEQIQPLFKNNFSSPSRPTASTSRSARSLPTPRPGPASSTTAHGRWATRCIWARRCSSR
jgi:hypothetical protein